MAVFWVQHYFTLPVIYEDTGMGDELRNRQPQSTGADNESNPQGHSQFQYTSFTQSIPTEQPIMEVQNLPVQSFGTSSYPNPHSFNMGGIAGSLPNYQNRTFSQPLYHQQYPLSSQSPQAYLIHTPQGGQFHSQPAGHYQTAFGQQYGPQYPPQQQFRSSSAATHLLQGNFPPNMQQFPQQSVFPSQGMMQTPPQMQQNYYQPPLNQLDPAFGMRATSAYGAPVRVDSNFTSIASLSVPRNTYQSLSRHSSDSSLKLSVPRGPPRKPKQSGHALWVGNLPPGTNVIDLKDHFSRDATEDIESVFLISKSNCAFVNYKSEAACTSAMARFHDSRFHGVRLVCRLRRGSTPTSATTPTTSRQDLGGSTAAGLEGRDQSQGAADPQAETVASTVDPVDDPEPEHIERVPEKFFIVKSLTVEDLESSVQNGVWATQAHNENTFNQAYQAAETVYLIFSANKSGEYFGYAKMTSAVGDEAAASIEVPAQVESPPPIQTELPVTIPTPATATAPKGHIIDDSARGTIFWEADTEPLAGDEETGYTSGEAEAPGDAGGSNPQTFGKPFKVTWISTERLPFYRTRGLRNPWNSNREVKIARDGTELEPSVGRRLLAMFHRPTMHSHSPISSRSQAQGPLYGFGQQHS